MPGTTTLASVEMEVAAKPKLALPAESEEPFRILVMGNFSSGAGRNRRPVEIDRDNFDQVMALLAPEVRLPYGGIEVPMKFRKLDDFHPDQLLTRLPLFQKLRNLRTRLADPATAREALAELEPRANPPEPDISKLSGADLLRLMTGEETTAPSVSPASSTWDQMIRELVGKYTVESPDPRQPAWLARTDDAITGEMRALLHHPKFQELESAWRGLHFLTRKLETGVVLKIYVMDLPLEELTEGAALGDVVRAVEADPLAVIAGLYAFGPSEEAVLARLAPLARNANAPFISGLAPDVVGIQEVFRELRRSLHAQWIGLAMPRFLLRLPYGAATDEIATFGFEEMPSPPEHERYLWGNPAIACAYLLGEAFSRYGWRMRPGMVQDIEGLPAHVYQLDGVSELKPCAEILLTDSAAELLLERGFMPLASMKGTDRVRLVRFQSLASPAAALAGKWE